MSVQDVNTQLIERTGVVCDVRASLAYHRQVTGVVLLSAHYVPLERRHSLILFRELRPPLKSPQIVLLIVVFERRDA